MKRKYSDTPEPRYVELARRALDAPESKAPSYLTITNIYSVEKGFRVAYTVNEEVAEIEIPLEGTDDVIVDIDDANMMINVHLDAKVRAKLTKVLTLPTEAPTTTEIVGIGINNAQTNLNANEVRSLLDVKRMIQMTQTAYDALGTKDSNTLYLIVG